MHTRGQYLISTDPALIDVDAVHAMLTRAYWSVGIPKATIARALDGSLNFGIYHNPLQTAAERLPAQVGIARVITDKATFAYLCDVFIHEDHRRQGLSKWLVEIILSHPDLQGLRRFCLLTRDAHTLYNRYGFHTTEKPQNYLERIDRDVYTRGVGGGQPQ